MKKILMLLCALCLGFILVGCNPTPPPNENEPIKVSLLTTGYVNLGVEGTDPYREWLKEEYNLDVSLQASTSLTSLATLAFVGNNKPDIVAFDTIDSFNTIQSQNVLIEDWTPYLDSMPNVKANVNRPDDKTGQESIAKKIMTTDDGKLKAVWTIPDAPTWSLKIREDWANEYRMTTVGGANYPAGNVATNGGPWNPNTPEDLLNFSRWIKANKPGSYGFTSAGEGKSLGTLGNWLPLMWGPVAEVPYGVYIDSNNEVNFPVLDGSHKEFIDYLKQICDEGLIDPQWYTQNWAQKTKTQQGLIGIEWYPGAITTETESYNPLNDGSRVNWWKTYNIPVDLGWEETGGFLPAGNFLGKIIAVSKAAQLNTKKMEAILKLINDVSVYYDEDLGQYVRPKAYDALRWGVGVEDHLEFLDVEGTNYKYINTNEGFRETSAGSGAWDWGAWIATTRDGVVQGSDEEVTAITQKVIEHNETTALMKNYIEIGGSFTGQAEAIGRIRSNQINFEYNYVTGEQVGTYEQFVNNWRNTWGGDQLIQAIKLQFIEFGWLKEQ